MSQPYSAVLQLLLHNSIVELCSSVFEEYPCLVLEFHLDAHKFCFSEKKTNTDDTVKHKDQELVVNKRLHKTYFERKLISVLIFVKFRRRRNLRFHLAVNNVNNLE